TGIAVRRIGHRSGAPEGVRYCDRGQLAGRCRCGPNDIRSQRCGLRRSRLRSALCGMPPCDWRRLQALLAAELGPKRLGLLKELVPTAMHYALLVNPDSPATDFIIADMRAAAASIGREIEVFSANSVREIDSAFAELVRKGCDALVVGASSLFATRRVQLATLTSIHRLPAIYYTRPSVEVGGLMSYGADVPDAVYQAGGYVGRILKGGKPADLPIIQSAKFEFVLNLQTARSLGLDVPPGLLAITDAVIE